MKKILTISLSTACLALLFIAYSFKGKTNPAGKLTLIVSQFDVQNAATVTQDIYKYNFENGLFTTKEKIITVQGKKDGKEFIRTDIGTNTLVKNRWIITGAGNIIDIVDKKVVSSNKAEIVRMSNDSVVLYTNDIFKGKFYAVLDCKSGKYGEVKSVLFKAKLGQDIEVDYATKNRQIWLYPVNKEKQLLVKDAGYGEIVVGAKNHSDIPVFWIDNNSFLFPYYNISQNEATIIKYDVSKKTETKVSVIKDLHANHQNSYFTKDGLGNLEYVCSKGKVLIDYKNNKASDVVFEHIGNNFDVEYKTQAYGHLIKFNKSEIGKYHFDLKNVKSCNAAIALHNQLKVGEEVYPQGIAYWNTTLNKWKKIEADEVASIIGWIEN